MGDPTWTTSPFLGAIDHGLTPNVEVSVAALSPTMAVVACEKSIGESQTLVVISLQNPKEPSVIGGMDHGLSGKVSVAALSPKMVVVASEKVSGASQTVAVLDLQNPKQPSVLSGMDHGLTPNVQVSVAALSPTMAVVACEKSFAASKTLVVLDLKNPKQPSVIGGMDHGLCTADDGKVSAAALSPTMVVLASKKLNGQSKPFLSIDLQNPKQPVILGGMNHGLYGKVSVAALSPTIAVVACEKTLGVSQTLMAIDLEDPNNPNVIGGMKHGLSGEVSVAALTPEKVVVASKKLNGQSQNLVVVDTSGVQDWEKAEAGCCIVL